MNRTMIEIPRISIEPVNEIFFAIKENNAWQKRTFEDLHFKLLLINGPNLNMLGRRDPAQYGTFTLRDVEQLSTDTATARGYALECFQSNHEGAIIDKIHDSMGICDGIVINPGAFTHYSYAIYDALELCGMPVVEIHISDISRREDYRRISVISPACIAQVKGMGIAGYERAVHILCDAIEKFMVRR
ncbi:MAG: type II 3-dehydroquinate dehydratase [Saccharofermentanales bacterium]